MNTHLGVDDKYQLLKAVYDKYNKNGNGLTFQQTCFMLAKLSKHIHALEKIEYRETLSVFAYFDKNGDGRLCFDELMEWWKTRDKYDYLVGEKARIIRTAYELYNKYSVDSVMSKEKFIDFLDDNEIPHSEYAFEALEKESKRTQLGYLLFPDFIKWLNWV